MSRRKQIKPGEKVPLKLTAAEKKLVLEDLTCLDRELQQILQNTPTGKPVLLSLDDLEDLGGYVAAEANHCDDHKKQTKLDALFEKIQRTMDNYTDEEPPPTLKIEEARKERMLTEQAVEIARFAAQALVAATELRIKTKPLENLWLEPGQREVVLMIPHVSKTIKNKLVNEKSLTVAEVASITMAVAEDLPEGEPQKQLALLFVAKHLIDRLSEEILARAEPPEKKKPKTPDGKSN